MYRIAPAGCVSKISFTRRVPAFLRVSASNSVLSIRVARHPQDRASRATAVVGSVCCAKGVTKRSGAALRADLERASALLPGGLTVVGAYLNTIDDNSDRGDAEAAAAKAEAEALVVALRRDCAGALSVSDGFAVAVGSSYFTCGGGGGGGGDGGINRVEAIELPEGWLEKEYVLLRCGMQAGACTRSLLSST